MRWAINTRFQVLTPIIITWVRLITEVIAVCEEFFHSIMTLIVNWVVILPKKKKLFICFVIASYETIYSNIITLSDKIDF